MTQFHGTRRTSFNLIKLVAFCAAGLGISRVSHSETGCNSASDEGGYDTFNEYKTDCFHGLKTLRGMEYPGIGFLYSSGENISTETRKNFEGEGSVVPPGMAKCTAQQKKFFGEVLDQWPELKLKMNRLKLNQVSFIAVDTVYIAPAIQERISRLHGDIPHSQKLLDEERQREVDEIQKSWSLPSTKREKIDRLDLDLHFWPLESQKNELARITRFIKETDEDSLLPDVSTFPGSRHLTIRFRGAVDGTCHPIPADLLKKKIESALASAIPPGTVLKKEQLYLEEKVHPPYLERLH